MGRDNVSLRSFIVSDVLPPPQWRAASLEARSEVSEHVLGGPALGRALLDALDAPGDLLLPRRLKT